MIDPGLIKADDFPERRQDDLKDHMGKHKDSHRTGTLFHSAAEGDQYGKEGRDTKFQDLDGQMDAAIHRMNIHITARIFRDRTKGSTDINSDKPQLRPPHQHRIGINMKTHPDRGDHA